MSFITADGQDYLLNLATGSEQAAANYYVALCLSEPGITATGSELDEVDTEGYARGQLANVSGSWQVMHGSMSNLVPVGFPIADADWGMIRTWVITDDAIAGRALWVGELNPTFVSEGDQLEIPSYGLTVYFGAAR